MHNQCKRVLVLLHLIHKEHNGKMAYGIDLCNHSASNYCSCFVFSFLVYTRNLFVKPVFKPKKKIILSEIQQQQKTKKHIAYRVKQENLKKKVTEIKLIRTHIF